MSKKKMIKYTVYLLIICFVLGVIVERYYFNGNGIDILSYFGPKIDQEIEAEDMSFVYDESAHELPIKAEGKLSYSLSNSSIGKISNNYLYLKNEGISQLKITAESTWKYNSAYKEVKVISKPRRIDILSLKYYPKDHKLTIKTSQDKKATGYQVQYSRNDDFKNKKSINIRLNHKDFTNLQKNKKYYFRVRAYKVSCGEKIFGQWSDTRAIKTK
ncbi:MAG: fibronectin type III domain-containing protein [Clostridia bacterium]|nr:fibronectin type III domain-containing protein [Clostridia bacterium]